MHRDIKPANILLEGASARIKITDFGLAKSYADVSLTATGVVAGTPEFMSPEQANEQEATERSDLFSLGAVLYTACTGESPFRGNTALTTLRRVCCHDANPLHEVDPRIPRWFSDTVQRLLSKDPSGRPQSAADVVDLLAPHRSDVNDASTFPTINNDTSLPNTCSHAHRSVGDPLSDHAPASVTVLDGAEGRAEQPISTGGPVRSTPSRWKKSLALTAVIMAACLLLAITFWPRDPNPPRSEPSKPREPSKPAFSGFIVSGVREPFTSLPDALAAAGADGVVEVHGDGPFFVPCLTTGENPVTIRAAKGSRPVFVPAPEGSVAEGPFLTATADVDLEGIEVSWQVQRYQTLRLDSLDVTRRQSVIDVDAANVSLTNCRIISEPTRTACLYIGQGSVELRNSHLMSQFGPCCLWGRSDQSRMRVENCVLEGRSGIMFDSSGGPVDLELAGNTFSTEQALNLVIGEPMRSVRISATRNTFDTSELVVMLRPIAFRGLGLSVSEFQSELKEYVQWQEHKNLYRSGTNYLSRGHGRRKMRFNVLVTTLGGWQAMWNQLDSGSGETEFEDASLDAGDSPGARPFADIRSAPATIDERIGADLHGVGPEAN